MARKRKLIFQVRELLWEKGRDALENARIAVSKENIPFEPLQNALNFFIRNWEDVMHPALLSLSCEKVGGRHEDTVQIGAAIVLLAGGADVHDDVIDQSRKKDSRLTVFGKFGKDMAILVGDALILEGLYILHEACRTLSEDKRRSILESTKQAFFEIGSAEAKETRLRERTDSLVAAEYLEMIKTKAAVGEVTTRIGAILGGGGQKEIDALSHYGRTLAILYGIRDEFTDAFELEEMRNRVERECLPLPILFALRDAEKKTEIERLIEKRPITQEKVDILLKLVIDSQETQKLKDDMQSLIEETTNHLHRANLKHKEFMLLLESSVEDL